ncbi:MAG TPA: sialidase family protein, partial [Chitinophagaceae bacterium]|nr:sialidase family protein [Chitinophagaceae bacterium]
FYLRKKSSQDCIPMMQISYDEAKTWSTPVPCITDKKGYFILNNCRVIQLASGRILVPVALHRTLEENVLQNKGRLFCYWSDDNGKTWHSSKEVPNPGGVITQEPGLVELKNNSVMMVIRTPMNLQYISTSKDSGKTWNAVYPSKIKSPVSPATISRIPFTNDLMLVWNNNDGNNPAIQGRRTPFNVALSNDEGDNWNAIKTLEDDPDGWYCYSAVHYVGHRYILLAYCAGSFSRGTGLAVTKIVRIKTDWLYSHED